MLDWRSGKMGYSCLCMIEKILVCERASKHPLRLLDRSDLRRCCNQDGSDVDGRIAR